MLRVILTLLTFAFSLSAGEKRTWTNAEGTKHFEAEFVKREDSKITLLRDDDKELTFDIAMLNEEDHRWLNLHYPLGDEGKGEAMPDPNAVFDTLKFGDSREVVSQKLKDSKIVETAVQGTFQGRTGLNGIYRTRHLIGGLYCYLYFDWTEAGGLKEITLQTENKTPDEYDTLLEPCWSELTGLIIPIHGKPSQTMGIPRREDLEDGQLLASHLWSIEHGGSVLLGTSRVGNGYQVTVRFTRERIQVTRTP